MFRYEDYIVSVIIKSQRYSQVSLEPEEVFYRSSKMQIYLYDQCKQKNETKNNQRALCRTPIKAPVGRCLGFALFFEAGNNMATAAKQITVKMFVKILELGYTQCIDIILAGI